jgi:hypothetical protein
MKSLIVRELSAAEASLIIIISVSLLAFALVWSNGTPPCC